MVNSDPPVQLSMPNRSQTSLRRSLAPGDGLASNELTSPLACNS
eukprot:CAMPEP_0119102910 /NCGR_PEP_ID=MMETSP1180-20130426/1500_1 /TAXON_ID=3052 ORGANISM="Chlamydomonas cf sp, Strain CCMP681" /NCGR_SAMPLE_ID=MMETSP1180 /ASSEMBLY_ACC=CAM_ASM_000741 /LENGTH=43 /DNA_ID= /DNA_START= /DNA_END= /DNA_ORIENTATION=